MDALSRSRGPTLGPAIAGVLRTRRVPRCAFQDAAIHETPQRVCDVADFSELIAAGAESPPGCGGRRFHAVHGLCVRPAARDDRAAQPMTWRPRPRDGLAPLRASLPPSSRRGPRAPQSDFGYPHSLERVEKPNAFRKSSDRWRTLPGLGETHGRRNLGGSKLRGRSEGALVRSRGDAQPTTRTRAVEAASSPVSMRATTIATAPSTKGAACGPGWFSSPSRGLIPLPTWTWW